MANRNPPKPPPGPKRVEYTPSASVKAKSPRTGALGKGGQWSKGGRVYGTSLSEDSPIVPRGSGSRAKSAPARPKPGPAKKPR